MGRRRTETLQIIMRHLVRIGPQRREFQSGFHGLEGEWIYLDGIENVFSAAERRKEVVDPGQQRIAAELPGISFPLHTERLFQMQAVLAGLPGKNRGASKARDDDW